jgi:hypothetical protein
MHYRGQISISRVGIGSFKACAYENSLRGSFAVYLYWLSVVLVSTSIHLIVILLSHVNGYFTTSSASDCMVE